MTQTTYTVEDGVTGYEYSVSSGMAADEYEKDTKAENTARPALVETRIQVTGSGQMRLTKQPVTFPCLFKDLPILSVGSSVQKNPNPNVWYDGVATAGVYSWIKDKSGYYTGANIWVRVEVRPINVVVDEDSTSIPPNDMQTIIHLTFSARAVKAMRSVEVTDDLEPNTPDL